MAVLFRYGQGDRGRENQITVFAASSFAYVLHENEALIEEQTGLDIVIVEAASSTLARQIVEGAPADVFIAADKEWLDYLAEGGLYESDPLEVARNRLVLVFSPPVMDFCQVHFFAPPSAPDLLGACPYAGWVATGDPAFVPLGKYAHEAIEFYQWSVTLAPAPDARAAYILLNSGATEAGLLYKTDVMASEKDWAWFEIPEESHSPILYWAVALKQSDSSKTENFLNFLKSESFGTILRAKDFEVN